MIRAKNYENILKFVTVMHIVNRILFSLFFPGHSGSLYLSVTPKFYNKVLHQTTSLTPN